MSKKKKKDIPFHIAHNYKQFELSGGPKFWAQDKEDADLYAKHIKWSPLSLKEITNG
jgi:L-lactate utilization protein LutB